MNIKGGEKMAIKISRTKNERGVALHTLNIGDTFLYDNRVGIIVERNGHRFPLDLTTCINFRKSFLYGNRREYGEELSGSEIVLPVEAELSYKVVG